MKTKKYLLRVENELYQKFKERSKKEHRSVNGFIGYLMEQEVKK